MEKEEKAIKRLGVIKLDRDKSLDDSYDQVCANLNKLFQPYFKQYQELIDTLVQDRTDLLIENNQLREALNAAKTALNIIANSDPISIGLDDVENMANSGLNAIESLLKTDQ